MGDQAKQSSVAQTKQEQVIEVRRSWQQPKLERLHVSMDTTNSPGSFADLSGPTCSC